MQGNSRWDGNPDGTVSVTGAGRWGLALALIALVAVFVFFGPQLWALAQDPEQLTVWVAKLGWLGPLALIALNALQIVIAPIPGYVVQLAAGFLFGALWGGIWGAAGLVAGGSLAFWLARIYGRPLAERLVGRARLARWEKITYSTSTLVWVILLLGPTGDAPFFLAGLSRVAFVKVLLITLVVRVPSAFVAAAAGAGVLFLTWWQLALIFALLAGIVLVFLRYHDRIVDWSEHRLQRQLEREQQNDKP
ncbi:MAG: TVP38/TMEM64 family protein [Caldilineaceae bacterium]|nr:TVP38/TMEM64 family protein [Caldilineaceae bacterium]